MGFSTVEVWFSPTETGNRRMPNQVFRPNQEILRERWVTWIFSDLENELQVKQAQ